ncbi:MAG: phage tail protein [Prevotellaceae bacterium]|jgi:phage protein U|nr:phage tail protein [Prevotellaceae bacterium]
MFAQLGAHIFQGLKLPGSWDEKHSERYGKIALVNGRDVVQHTGRELSELNIDIVYSVEFCEPATEIDALRQSMHKGEVLPFISGEGAIIGKFIITGIDVEKNRFSHSGRLEMASVSLSLLEYDYPVGKKNNGKALKRANPTPLPPAPPVASVASAICADIDKGTLNANAAATVVEDVEKNKKTFKQGVREVRRLSDNTARSYRSAKTKVVVTKKIVQRAGRLPTSLDAAIRYAENLSTISNVSDMEVLKKDVGKMKESAGEVKSSAAPVAAFFASREGGK